MAAALRAKRSSGSAPQTSQALELFVDVVSAIPIPEAGIVPAQSDPKKLNKLNDDKLWLPFFGDFLEFTLGFIFRNVAG